MKTRDIWIWGGLVAAAVACATFGLSDLLSAQHEFDTAGLELSQCRLYAREIRQLQQRPRLASLGAGSPEQTLRRVSQSLLHAGMDVNSLLSVSPSEPIRLAGSQYQLRSTELALSGITLPQLAELAESVTVEEDGSQLRDVVLVESALVGEKASNRGERWDARLTLTQLIYSPTSQ